MADDPHPPASKRLDFPDSAHELYRFRLDRWRIIYAITEADKVIDILAVRKRPPYDYDDLVELLEEAL
jgi:mRNA interferase RelE/StbE